MLVYLYLQTRLSILWKVSRVLVGNEESQISNVSIRLSPSSSDNESNVSNNLLMNGPLVIMYGAVADLDVSAL